MGIRRTFFSHKNLAVISFLWSLIIIGFPCRGFSCGAGKENKIKMEHNFHKIKFISNFCRYICNLNCMHNFNSVVKQQLVFLRFYHIYDNFEINSYHKLFFFLLF